MKDSLLTVRDLHVEFPTPRGTVQAVRGISFHVEAGEVLGVVGESGSGKSVTLQSILGLVAGAETTGEALFEGRDLLTLSDKELQKIRGERIGFVFQDPLTSLHPMFRVGWQLAESIRLHEAVSRKVAKRRAVEMLAMVGIANPASRVDDYPHQFSGGMRQRVLLAMALALGPDLLIADEPTTALDATVQADILATLRRLQSELSMALVIVTHDFGVVAEMADRLMVMYAGRVVEGAGCSELFRHPSHPYTLGLLGSVPEVGANRSLAAIPGQPPRPGQLPVGCSFSPRCGHAHDRCRQTEPSLAELSPGGGHQLACWLQGRLPASPALAPAEPADHSVSPPTAAEPAGGQQPVPMLSVVNLVKEFRHGRSGRKGDGLRAVDGVTLAVKNRSTLGLVGETGSGKSTLARCMARLIDATSGTVRLEDRDITSVTGKDLAAIRREIQFVFQDPFGSLNPRRTVGAIIAEPLRAHRLGTRIQRRDRVRDLMDLVGLDPDSDGRYPSEFSGGQRQRIGIARALAVDPRVLICDEPVSALDVSIQAQVIQLLKDLQRKLSLACVFISHDLGVVEYVSDEIAVMYAGRIVEQGRAEDIYRSPRHPYTQALLSNAPVADPERSKVRTRVVLRDDQQGRRPPSGCPFEPRCPRSSEMCTTRSPSLEAASTRSSHLAACFHPIEAPQPFTSTVGSA